MAAFAVWFSVALSLLSLTAGVGFRADAPVWQSHRGGRWIDSTHYLGVVSRAGKTYVARLDFRAGQIKLVREIDVGNGSGAAFSPDGAYLLFHRGGRSAGRVQPRQWTVLSLKSGRRISWPQAPDTVETTSAAWLPDGKRWAELVFSTQQIRIHTVERPRAVNVVPIGTITTPQGDLRRAQFLVGITRGNQALLRTGFRIGPNREGEEGFATLDLFAGRPAARSFALPAAMDGSLEGIGDVVVCSKGAKIAFAYTFHKTPPGRPLVSARPVSNRNTGLWEAIYISDIDGANRHCVGHLPLPDNDYPDSDLGLTWLPNGKQLSVIWGNKLLVVH